MLQNLFWLPFLNKNVNVYKFFNFEPNFIEKFLYYTQRTTLALTLKLTLTLILIPNPNPKTPTLIPNPNPIPKTNPNFNPHPNPKKWTLPPPK